MSLKLRAPELTAGELGKETRKAVHPCLSLSLGPGGHGVDLAAHGDRAMTKQQSGP